MYTDLSPRWICILSSSLDVKATKRQAIGYTLEWFFSLISLIAIRDSPKCGLNFTVAANMKYKQWKILFFFFFCFTLTSSSTLLASCWDCCCHSFAVIWIQLLCLFIMDWTPVGSYSRNLAGLQHQTRTAEARGVVDWDVTQFSTSAVWRQPL